MKKIPTKNTIILSLSMLCVFLAVALVKEARLVQSADRALDEARVALAEADAAMKEMANLLDPKKHVIIEAPWQERNRQVANIEAPSGFASLTSDHVGNKAMDDLTGKILADRLAPIFVFKPIDPGLGHAAADQREAIFRILNEPGDALPMPKEIKP